jgi:hypothetical protein
MTTRFLIAASLLALAACGSKSDGNSTKASGGGGGLFGGGAVSLQPGEWEMTMELLNIDAPGMPPQVVAAMKQQTAKSSRTCISPEEAKGPKPGDLTGQGRGNCKNEGYVWEGGRIAGTTVCTGEGTKSTAVLDGSYTPQSMTLSMKNTTEAAGNKMVMDMRMSGRRVGDCPAGKEDS